jgi:hypothetical protein
MSARPRRRSLGERAYLLSPSRPGRPIRQMSFDIYQLT